VVVALSGLARGSVLSVGVDPVKWLLVLVVVGADGCGAGWWDGHQLC